MYDLAALASKRDLIKTGKTVMIYGRAKTGKTKLAASIAKSKNLDNIYWFDMENGWETLLTLVDDKFLTLEEAAKIKVIRIEDSIKVPIAFETMGKVLSARLAVKLCNKHGRDMAMCKECTTTKGEFFEFDIKKLGHRDCIVYDTGSQLSDSIMHYYSKGEMEKGTGGMDNYREQGLRLVEMLTEIQRGSTNHLMITHELVVEFKAGTDQLIDVKYSGPVTEKSYPMIGTKPFSLKVGKYFGHVIFLEVDSLKKHKGGSSTDYRADTITGSRSNYQFEKKIDPTTKKLIWDISDLF